MRPGPPFFRKGLPAKGTLYHLLFGNEPWPFLLVILACGLGLLALSDSFLWAILGTVLVVILARALLWGQVSGEGQTSDSDEGQP